VWPIHRFRNYLIFYRHIGESVEVLHIWHGARDIPALLADLD
jgi:plasmid stabilization system protein ParE